MQIPPVNPIPQIMLVVNARQRPQQIFSSHAIFPQFQQFATDRPCDWPAKRLFQKVAVKNAVIQSIGNFGRGLILELNRVESLPDFDQ